MVPAAVSVCKANKHPSWMYHISERGYLKPFVDAPIISRRQELSRVYVLNGALYLAQTKWLNHTRNFISDETLGYEMPTERSVDIDNPIDWEWTNYLLANSVK